MKVPQSLRDLIEAAESLVYLEDLSNKKGLLQTINPLAKLVATVAMIVASLCIFNLSILLLICVVPLFLAVASRIPLKQMLSRTAMVTLFSAFIAVPWIFGGEGTAVWSATVGGWHLAVTSGGLMSFAVFVVRVWFCVASLITMVLSMGFDRTLKLLSSLRVPAVVIQLFSLTYRYFFVSLHEAQSVLIGKEARTYVHKKTFNLQSLRDLGSVLSSLFIRTYERSERVYLAMKARGFEVSSDTRLAIPKMHVWDVAFAASLIVAFAYLALL
ncbi:MAG: cobalt ECF transporter T component CbiQ [Candidatus Bathyarchaeota archaeon]|nr:cobalt ECF transporter T component CbiQ [Candidatus Bathyarchaeota archaeon]